VENQPVEGQSEKRRWIWQCLKCGHAVVAEAPPTQCPGCGATPFEFTILEED
jgi:rubrerythrin